MNRGKKLAKNTIFSLLLQLVTIISSFILPRLVLSYFGSDVNGLINSISQFLQIISFLELGVGAVVQSALYKPLAECDNEGTSRIITSADRFFRRIGLILVCYVVVLAGIYPFISNQKFDYLYTVILIVAMSISTFAQYYFGIVDQLLLTTDQRGYVYYCSAIITILLNTATCSLLIIMGCSIQVVKLTTSVIYLARPLILRRYINEHYKLNRKIEYSEEPIKQKWNGIAQHVAGVVLDHTDTIVLTVFSTMSSVSIYSVYHMVIYGVKTLFTSITNGVQALLGELYARNNNDELRKSFDWVEWVIHTGVVLIFGCTAVLIIPFVQVYTKGVSDADYYQPLFSALIVCAHGIHCLRLPYHIMIKASGHYKETQTSYLIAAGINVVVSVIMVNLFGLVGVAFGTLIAMIYQTIWMACYNSSNLMKRPLKVFIKQVVTDIVTLTLCLLFTYRIKIYSLSYIEWIKNGVFVFAIFLSVIIIVNIILYREKAIRLFRWTIHRIMR